MRCLVIGGAGFIGCCVSNMLAESGRDVIVLGRETQRSIRLSKKVTYVSGDYSDRTLLRKLLIGTDETIDLAYSTVPKSSFEDPVADILSNLPAGVGLIQEASMGSLKKFLFVSSGGTVYGPSRTLPIREDHPTNPISPYGITKLTLEKYILMYHSCKGLPAVIVRPSNAYGEYQQAFTGQGFIATAIKSIISRQPVNIFGRNGTIRDYIHVEDVACGIIAALDCGEPGNAYNIGSGAGLSNTDILNTIEPYSNHHELPVVINIQPERVFDVPANVLDCTKLKTISNWQPKIALDDGIGRTWMAAVKKQ